jgi:hypothetical protein
MDGKWGLEEARALLLRAHPSAAAHRDRRVCDALAIHRPPNARAEAGYAIFMIKRILKLLALKKMFDAFRDRRRHAQPR